MNVELTDEQRITVANSKMVFTVMHEILMRENYLERGHEHVWCLCLSPENKILNIELISLGAIDDALIKPMQVYRIAVHKGAVKIILVHNHCFESLEPSITDEEVTDRMYQVGRILGIKFLDHMIINEDGFYSFLDTGKLEEISKSLKWVPVYEEEERLKKEKKSIEEKAKKEGFEKGLQKGINRGKKEGIKEGMREGKKAGIEQGIKKGIKEGVKEGIKQGVKEGIKEGERKKAQKVAKALKKQGDSVSKIAAVTGLTAEEIEEL